MAKEKDFQLYRLPNAYALKYTPNWLRGEFAPPDVAPNEWANAREGATLDSRFDCSARSRRAARQRSGADNGQDVMVSARRSSLRRTA
jgi:hypothetical protein